MKGFRWGLCIAAAVIMAVATAGPAVAAPKEDPKRDCAGRGVPVNKISIQLWTFAEYIGFGTDAATIERTEQVFQALREMGYRNVEPFTLSGLSAEEYRALLDKYGLKASARHVNVGTPESPVDFDQILEENRTLGIRFFGSGGTPQYTTEAEWIAYAEYLNELGAQARQAGQRLMVHNHNWEFETVFGDRSAFDILVEHTDRRNVVFQVDLYWATRGLGVAAGVTSVDAADDLTADLLEQLGNRVQLFHVKDMATGMFPGRIEIVGEGGIDFPMLFDAAKGRIRYYVVEHDPRFGDPTFDPFEAAQKGFDYLDCVTF
jgi:sugar phosphate isomerase/epimerase